MTYRIPLVFTPQPEGGYTVTSPVLPEMITEGDTLKEARANVEDAFAAVVEIYAEQNRALPAGILLPASRDLKIGTLRGAVKQLGIDWADFEKA